MAVEAGTLLERADQARAGPRLSARDISVYYGEYPAVAGVTLPFQPSAITALIGPSGCGKSSLLRVFNRMNDLIRVARVEGSVYLDGVDIYERNVDVVELRRRVGMVFQVSNPFPMSVFDNVAYGPRRRGVTRRRELEAIVQDSLRRAVLWDEVKEKLSSSAGELSGGQQQRLAIARVLAVRPEIILMDEPCSALDPSATLRIEDLMRDLARHYTIIVVTHNMQQAARVSDYAAFLLAEDGRTGRLVEYGPTETVFTTPSDKRTEDYITGRFG